MGSKKIGLPQGVSDTLFDRYIGKAKLESALLQNFTKHGFRTVATPTFEYVDVFDVSNDYSERTAYKFSDDEGRLMALRCDSSSPIARMVGSYFKNSAQPLKISYNQPVYKRQVPLGGKRHEIGQSGVELIGGLDEFSDNLEMLELAAQSLEIAELNDFKIELGHAELFCMVADRLPLGRAERELLHDYMESKNVAALSELLAPYKDKHQSTCDLLGAMPQLFGDRSALEKAKQLFCTIPEATEILESLEKLYDCLCEQGLCDKISFDFGLVQQFGYYTGIIFSGYSTGSGEALLSGGRYDKLYGEYGEHRNAIGFVVNIDAILDVKSEQPQELLRPLRLALTKGRLQKNACKLMESAGMDMSEINSGTRKLIVPVEGGKYELILAKAADVITYVTHGVCDIGLVGKDTMQEHEGGYYELLDTGFGRCKFAVAAPKGFSYEAVDGSLNVATKYPRVTKNFFASKGLNVDIIKIDGSVELAPLLGLADVIVDIVETGETLRANGLEVVEEISDISARIIANIASMKLRKNEIEELISLMDENNR